MPISGTPATYWVCVDCYFEHHGVVEEYDGDRGQLLALIPSGADVTAGIMWEEHAEDCPNRSHDDAPDEETECECAQLTFTGSPCDGCGSTLGGAREALTVWEAVTPAAVGGAR